MSRLDSSVAAVLRDALAQRLGHPVQVLGTHAVSGGSIHTALRVDTDAGAFFLKTNSADAAANFEAEAAGLTLLQGRSQLRVPAVVATGTSAGQAWLLMDWLAGAAPTRQSWALLGEGLAALHLHTQPRFGLAQDNYIGSLAQSNAPADSWAEFYVQRRLQPQRRLAHANSYLTADLERQLERLYLRLPDWVPEEPPALLHGDLWSGNVLPRTDPRGIPSIFDPAVYYGHRESDLAMTRLFGGFDGAFYDAYLACHPLAPAWEERVPLHQLYPLMVHLNLFGMAYLPQIQAVLRRYA
jgi:protein-ribulosamine 3-kinase